MNYEYDENERLVKAVDVLRNVWIWDYDLYGNLIHHKSPSTEWTKEYDRNNREIRYACENRVVVTSYDNYGVATQAEM